LCYIYLLTKPQSTFCSKKIKPKNSLDGQKCQIQVGYRIDISSCGPLTVQFLAFPKPYVGAGLSIAISNLGTGWSHAYR